MSLFTIDDIHSAAIKETGATNENDFSEKADALLLEQFIDQATVNRFDIYLTHACSGKKVVVGTYCLLRKMGFTVYVDWIHDRHIDRTTINPATADTLQQRMLQCESLMFITTRRCTTSEWMPWECGYFDGHGGRVAILPIVDQPAETYEGREFLGFYPFISRSHLGSGKNQLRIHNPREPTRSSFYENWVGGENP